MDANVINSEGSEGQERCACEGGTGGGITLAVLQEVQRAYEQRMDMLEKVSGSKKLQLQVDLLRSWVGDLVGQNTLLARAVEELEAEATTRLFLEERKHTEKQQRSMYGQVNELKTLNESLHKENVAQDRELRKLRKDIQQHEETVMNLKSEISLLKYCTPNVSKKDAEVMAGMCCTGAECGDWEPVKDFNSVLCQEMVSYQERIQKMEVNLKSSGKDVRTLRMVNMSLREKLHSLRGVCATLWEECCSAAVSGKLKDDIIWEMRQQLKRAKAKWDTCDVTTSTADIKTSTPNASRARNVVDFGQSYDVSIIEPSLEGPIFIRSNSGEALLTGTESSSIEPATCARTCTHVQGTCASNCKHIPNCPRAVSTAKCAWRCKHILECAQQLIGTCALRCKHVSDCGQCRCASKCQHVPECTRSQATCVSKWKLAKDRTQSQPIPSCALKCDHVPKCTPEQAVGTCALQCIHVQNDEATCVSKSKHIKDCTQSRSIVPCALKCNHVPECTPGEAVGPCALKCIHVRECTHGNKRDKAKCATKCEHIKDCNQIKSNASSALRCNHVPECTTRNAIGICALKCIHVEGCAQGRESDTCVSKCNHVPECCNQTICGLKSIHLSDCPQGQKKASDATMCKHALDCKESTCALNCIHVKNCTEAEPKATCSSRFKNNEQLLSESSAESSISGLGSQLVGKYARALQSLSGITLTKSSPKLEIQPRSVSFDIDAKESVGTSSAADSPSSSCASARAHYYQSKLLATLQILQNKEETVRVQAESLAVAESRISRLTARSAELKKDLERKGRELQNLRKAFEESRTEKIDVSITAQLQEMENQRNIVSTLQNNLSVIEDLYRECFYESVKQDNLVDMLRKSYLDVRLTDKEKSDEISKLHNVINTQKWSLDKCEDIATEVDNLKMEISTFLNSSNNDSGMWEESFAGGLSEDLQDIAAQLLRLRELLTGDCTCGLEEENSRLKQDNEVLEIEIGDLRIRITELEVNLVNTEKLNKRYQEQIENKEKELRSIRAQVTSMEKESKELRSNNDRITCQLNRTQVDLEEKCSELSTVQKHCEACEEKIRTMTKDLGKTEQIAKENASLRSELCASARGASRLQRQVDTLEEELVCARAHCEHVEASYRAKSASTVALESQLDEAQSRGAELCGEARRVVTAVRGWVARMKEIHREQEEQMKRKECEMRCLQQRLEQRQIDLPSRIFQSEKYCSDRPSTDSLLIRERRRCTVASSPSEMEPTCSKLLQRNEGSFGSACDCVREGREPTPCTSASEMGSCGSAPVPPKRMLRKKPLPCVIRKQQCEASMQQPVRSDAATCSADVGAGNGPCGGRVGPCARGHGHTVRLRPVSPGEEMFSRIESMSLALADGYRRWTRDKHDKR